MSRPKPFVFARREVANTHNTILEENMSEPFDFPFPYGVTVEGDGAERIAKPVSKSSKLDHRGYLILPSGPCRIAASWDGPESVRITVAGVGYPITIPAGGGSRSAMATFGAKGERLYLENVAAEPLRRLGRGTIEVYPVNLE